LAAAERPVAPAMLAKAKLSVILLEQRPSREVQLDENW
jgi:hypothetical protein